MAAQEHHTIRYLIWFGFWIVLLGLVAYLFQILLEHDRNPNLEPEFSLNSDVRQVVLKQNRYGHYHTTGYINGKQVEFLLDTGATDISVPEHIAGQLGLKKLYETKISTANGIAKAYGTHVESARVGNIELKDLKATINPNVSDNTVLLGMSFLRRIEFTQRGGILILKQYR